MLALSERHGRGAGCEVLGALAAGPVRGMGGRAPGAGETTFLLQKMSHTRRKIEFPEVT